MALCNIGPLQTRGFFSSIKKPIDITSIPFCLTGIIFFLSFTSGFLFIFSNFGIDGPYISPSSNPTFFPSFFKDRAKLTDKVDFPTPPLQLDTTITFENFFLIVVNVTFISSNKLKSFIFCSHSFLRFSNSFA